MWTFEQHPPCPLTCDRTGLADATSPHSYRHAKLPRATIDSLLGQKADFWLLDHHRLFRGDACEEADMRVLMGRDRATMVFADPPCNRRISSIVRRGKSSIIICIRLRRNVTR